MKKILTLILFVCLCSFSYSQGVPDWKLGVSLPLSQKNPELFFENAKKAGVEYVEISMPYHKTMPLHEFTSRVALFKTLCDKNGIKIWSIHIPFNWDTDISTVDPIKRRQCKDNVLFCLDLARGLGDYTMAVIHPSYEPVSPINRQDNLKALRESLIELGALVVNEYNVRLAVECLPRTCLGNSSDEMNAIIIGIPSVDVCFDVNHLLGEKSENFGRNVGKRIKTLHISDYDEINERHWLPGKGVINWNEVVDALVKSGYDGPFMMEITTTPWGDDTDAFCQDMAKSWKKIKDDYAKFKKK